MKNTAWEIYVSCVTIVGEGIHVGIAQLGFFCVPRLLYYWYIGLQLTWTVNSSELFWSPFVYRTSVRLAHPLSVCKLSTLIFIFFSRTTGPTKLGTTHHWVKGIQFALNERPHSFLIIQVTFNQPTCIIITLLKIFQC